jgi:hypothetical protein
MGFIRKSLSIATWAGPFPGAVQYRSDTERGTHQTKLLRQEIERQGRENAQHTPRTQEPRTLQDRLRVVGQSIPYGFVNIGDTLQDDFDGSSFTVSSKHKIEKGGLFKSTFFTIEGQKLSGELVVLERSPTDTALLVGTTSSDSASLPPEFDESQYLIANPDVAAAVQQGDFRSGTDHFLRFGADEGRQLTTSVGDKPGEPSLRSMDDRVSLIERLAALRDSGAISEAEFEAEKSKIL